MEQDKDVRDLAKQVLKKLFLGECKKYDNLEERIKALKDIFFKEICNFWNMPPKICEIYAKKCSEECNLIDLPVFIKMLPEIAKNDPSLQGEVTYFLAILLLTDK